jgi:transcriptional regulator with XRE-family HTH domain
MKITSVHRPEHAILAALLRDCRVEAGMTQAQAAEKLGVTQTTISKLEINERGVDFLVARDLCAIYGVDMHWLLDEVDSQSMKQKLPRARLVRKDKKKL